VKTSRDSLLYNLSLWIFKSKPPLKDEFVDLLTAATKSQIKVSTTWEKFSKYSMPYNQSISTLNGR